MTMATSQMFYLDYSNVCRSAEDAYTYCLCWYEEAQHFIIDWELKSMFFVFNDGSYIKLTEGCSSPYFSSDGWHHRDDGEVGLDMFLCDVFLPGDICFDGKKHCFKAK